MLREDITHIIGEGYGEGRVGVPYTLYATIEYHLQINPPKPHIYLAGQSARGEGVSGYGAEAHHALTRQLTLINHH